MPCIDPQKLTLFAYPPSSASLTLRHLPHPRGKAYAAVRSFCVTSSALLTLRHLPHPRGKAYAAVRSFCVTSSALLTLRHLPHPRGKAYAAVRSFCVTSSAFLTLRHLPPQGGRLMPPFVLFVSPHPPPGTFPIKGKAYAVGTGIARPRRIDADDCSCPQDDS